MAGGSLNIDTSNTNELDNIEYMLNKTAPKRDDGIELIINTKAEAEDPKENKDENDKDEDNKKTIKLI